MPTLKTFAVSFPVSQSCVCHYSWLVYAALCLIQLAQAYFSICISHCVSDYFLIISSFPMNIQTLFPFLLIIPASEWIFQREGERGEKDSKTVVPNLSSLVTRPWGGGDVGVAGERVHPPDTQMELHTQAEDACARTRSSTCLELRIQAQVPSACGVSGVHLPATCTNGVSHAHACPISPTALFLTGLWGPLL